jgi:hypothetical protein
MASDALTWAVNNGMSVDEYYGNIVNFVNENRGMNDVQLAREMDKYGVSAEDVAAATGVPLGGVEARYEVASESDFGGYTPTDTEPMSAGLAWGLANGMTQAQIDKNIFDFVNANRGLNDAQLRAEMDKWGISPNDVARATGVSLGGVKARYDVANTATFVPPRVTDVTKLIVKPVKPVIPVNPLIPTTITPTTPVAPTVTAGQMRELFPSFAESKRLAGEMVAGRPTTQSIVDMIQGANISPTYRPPPTVAAPTGLMDAWSAAEASGNYGDVANMLKGLTTNDLRNYGASAADIAYITSRPEIAGMFQTATPTAPSLNNVLSMIGK